MKGNGVASKYVTFDVSASRSFPLVDDPSTASFQIVAPPALPLDISFQPARRPLSPAVRRAVPQSRSPRPAPSRHAARPNGPHGDGGIGMSRAIALHVARCGAGGELVDGVEGVAGPTQVQAGGIPATAGGEHVANVIVVELILTRSNTKGLAPDA